MARHLARADRDALHGVLRDDLRHCSYVAVAIESGDYASARTVANRRPGGIPPPELPGDQPYCRAAARCTGIKIVLSAPCATLDRMTVGEPPIGLRERKKLETRRAIRAAALELFEREGFDKVSVDQVAAAANVSRTTFFNFFPTKEAVVFDADPEQVAQWQALLASRPADEPLWTALQEVLLGYLEGFREHLVAKQRIKAASRTLGASSRDANDRFWAELTEWAARRDDGDPLTVSLQLGVAQAVLNSAFALWDVDDGTEPLLRLIRRGFAEAGAGFRPAPSRRTPRRT